VFAVVCTSCNEQPATTDLDLPEVVDFNDHIRPIFTKNCAACHGGVKKSGGLSYVFREEAIADGLSGNRSIVPGDPDASYLIQKVSSKDPAFRMPPVEHGPALKDQEIGLLRQWIEEGAEWEEHWAFMPVPTVEVPQPQSDWGHNQLDAFILERLDQEGLQPSAEAEKGTLLRRLSLDLTGVPPTQAELKHFFENEAPDAYEQEVERLLASSRYGERWATMWLDLARYADSEGAGQDAPRTIYKFRDWVIRAFNDDLPFDQFSIKQLAGDLLPDATYDDFVAAAFHRNTQAEDEGGTDDEEFRVVAIMDRVNTTWQVWHGTTFGCVQCHSHPYDPFRHDEYYEFAAFFNNTQDADTRDDYPFLSVPKDEAKQVELGGQFAEMQRLHEANWSQAYELMQSTDWTWLQGMSVKTNKDKQLSYTVEAREGREEFVFDGTPTRIKMDLNTDAPVMEQPVQAVRVEVAPLDLESAPYKPSPGFVLEEFQLKHVAAADQKETAIPFDRVYLDEPYPFLWGDPKKGGASGFAAYTRIFNNRTAVFRLKKPLKLQPGDELKFYLEHGRRSGEKELLLLRRSSLAVTEDLAWRELESSETWSANKQRIDAINKELKDVPKVKIPITRERPEHLARGTKVFIRGNWTTLGEAVLPDTPASLHPVPQGDQPERLKMAEWLVDKENPLAARVLVSRFWEQLFGTGLVETLEDFGSIGELPSHPELLDYLANQLMHEYNWSMKSLLREIVSSAAYRQDSASSSELETRDPKNRLLARGPRNRMTGEMVRDQVLALAGKLNDTMYGVPIKPPLPEGGWSPSHNAAGAWVAHEDDRIFRRSIYIHWQRSSPYPVFTAFDAPMRDLCTDRRVTSNTPVQPLFTLNDPALFTAMQAFSVRMKDFSDDLASNIGYGYRLATTKEIPEPTLAELMQLYGKIVAAYPEEVTAIEAAHEVDVKKRLQAERDLIAQKRKQILNRAKNQKKDPPPEDELPDPKSVKRGPEHDFNYSAELAAYDAVSSVILNLDEVLTK